jgi:hypothetical protein
VMTISVLPISVLCISDDLTTSVMTSVIESRANGHTEVDVTNLT